MDIITARLLLDYLYGGVKSKLSCDEAVQLFIASDKYDVKHSYLHCVRALETHLTIETWPVLSALARQHCCSSLEQVQMKACFHDHVA